MTHCEQPATFKYTAIADGYAGFVPGTPIRQTSAPTWMTIQPRSGWDTQISAREDTEYTFDVYCNWRDDFTWQRNMFIVSRFGNLDVRNIVIEEKRKRTVKLETVLIAGSSEVPPTTRVETFHIYVFPTPGSSSFVLPGSDDWRGALLFFRDGIEKQILTPSESFTRPDQVQKDGDTFTLYPGDIFGPERVTILYTANAGL